MDKIHVNDTICFKVFQEEMIKAIEEKQKIYGNSWLRENEEWMVIRLRQKYGEFDLIRNPDKLISLANIAMLLYTKYKLHPETLEGNKK